MDLQRLLHFRTVVEAGGLNAAARLLHLSGGALSKSIRRLEDELGSSLFDRAGRSLELSDFGRRIYGRSERLIAEYRHFMRGDKEADAGPVPTVRVATFEPFSTYVLGAVLETEPELAQLEWRVLDVGVGEIERAVRDLEADVGVTYAPVPGRGLSFRRLVKVRFGLYGLRRAFDGVDPSEYPHAAPVTRLRMNAANLLAVDSWPSEFVARRVRFRLTSLESALELARRGRCAVHLPQFIARLHNLEVRAALRLAPLDTPAGYKAPSQWVHLVTRDEDRNSEPLLRYGRALRAVLAGDAE